MEKEKQSEPEKSHGWWSTIFESLTEKLNLKRTNLPSLDDVLKITHPENSRYIGACTIEVDKIIGSEGRYTDFEKNFLPVNESLKQRYDTIKSLYLKGHLFRPISVYKIDDYYFVRDGNHRVAVAKELRQEFIDAEVTELITDVPITKELTPKDRLLISEHSMFLRKTGLGKYGRDSNIHLTEPYFYYEMFEIISEYVKLLSQKRDKEISIEEGAEEWYRQIFLPFAEEAYSNDLLSAFPGRTTGDLYVWVQMHWADIRHGDDTRYSYISEIGDSIKPAVEEDIPGREFKLLKEILNRQHSGVNNFLRNKSIGIAVCCVLFHIDSFSNVKIILVRRKYHPCERQWSLPIGMMRHNETILEVARRCQHNVLGLENPAHVKLFSTHDKVDRHPFGRSIGLGVTGFLYNKSEQMKFIPGDQASEIYLCPPDHIPELVFDHNEIITESFRAMTNLARNFDELINILPPDIPAKAIMNVMAFFKHYAAKSG
ncbi:hypothetical protein CHS0354_013134 [Potamilus streckersoni]|uniref:Nudix hydrolase domain-containing protein n=1 Tax=Potamilus streckersoni TaxID=2493646 RepID=A0AAE0VQ75_9BIVA|nr:hypothetical protein CHS0354_013134 [Potamilus streckersoni]